MKENFNLAVDFVLKHEGGYSNDPNDPGGETNFGISKRYHPDVDVKNLTVEGAEQIYKAQYWDAYHCDDLPFPIDIIAMDTVVNCRPQVEADEIKMSKVMAANARDEALFVRAEYYVNCVVNRPSDVIYFFGWMNRVIELRQLIHDEQKRRTI